MEERTPSFEFRLSLAQWKSHAIRKVLGNAVFEAEAPAEAE